MRVKSKQLNWRNADTAREGKWLCTREAAEPSTLVQSGCYNKMSMNFRGTWTFRTQHLSSMSREAARVYMTLNPEGAGVDGSEYCNIKLIRENLSIWQWWLISWQGPLETLLTCSWRLGKIKNDIKLSKNGRIFTADGSGRDQITF